MIACGLKRTELVALTLGVTLAPGTASARSCPSYGLGSQPDDGKHHCGVVAVAGRDPTVDDWKAILTLVAQGPKAWRGHGPVIPDMKADCGGTRKVPAAFPCEVLKAIAQKESAWHQFCGPTEPASERGKPSQTLIARDCGYGVSQVTSGMSVGGKATFDRQRVASDPFYNAAAGASLLAQKWQAYRCVEDRDPGVIEHWYIALWAYNGYSYSNDPSNPIYSSTRGVWNPAVGGGAPYQERVFGIIEKGSQNGKLWKPVALAYPRIEDVAGRGSSPVARIECASPTDCTSKRPTHRSACDPAEAAPLLAAWDRAAGTSAATGGRIGAGGSVSSKGTGGVVAGSAGASSEGTNASSPAASAAEGCGRGATSAAALMVAAGATTLFVLLRRRARRAAPPGQNGHRSDAPGPPPIEPPPGGATG